MKKVAIITRTKNRDILLTRAFQSVKNQTFNDYIWIIVNDGGSFDNVDNFAANIKNSSNIDVQVINNKISQDRGEALNIGVINSKSDYIAIHDDDDTWHPDFLKETISALETQKRNIYGGVVTRCYIVEESIDIASGQISFKKKYPHNYELNAITLFNIAKLNNNFPPISFVYRRSIHDDIGSYRKDLTVLEDWEFYLRFLTKYNIAVIPEYLANYHIRINHKIAPNYSNTITSQINIHKECHATLLNEFLRQDLESGKLGLGLLTNLAYEISQTQRLFRRNSLIEIIKQFYIKNILRNN